MSACAMLTYNNVTQDVWQCIVSAVAQYGIPVAADSGTQSAQGFTISWNYNRQAETLSVQCIDSPFWAPCSTVNAHINDAAEACLGQHQAQLIEIVPR